LYRCLAGRRIVHMKFRVGARLAVPSPPISFAICPGRQTSNFCDINIYARAAQAPTLRLGTLQSCPYSLGEQTPLQLGRKLDHLECEFSHPRKGKPQIKGTRHSEEQVNLRLKRQTEGATNITDFIPFYVSRRTPARLLVDSLFPIKHADFRPGLTH
jgi:hypothetical protein